MRRSQVLSLLSVFSFSLGTVAFSTSVGAPATTLRSGSSGSAGTTAQGPVYDGGVRGPNAAMGEPDTTAVNRESSGAITRKKKNPVGSIRLDAQPGISPTPSVTPSPSPQGP